MAYVIIKSDERKNLEKEVARSFGVNSNNRERMEMAETVAARTMEAKNELRRMEVKRR